MKRILFTVLITLFLAGAAYAFEDPLIDTDLSFNVTSVGITETYGYCAINGQFNLSVYYNTSGSDQGVTFERLYRGDGDPDTNTDWRPIIVYDEDTETCDEAVNGRWYFYRFRYTGTDGGCHVRIDQ